MKLSTRIKKFLNKYARKVDDEWTSPDAYQLEACAEELETKGTVTNFPWSEWGSGGYHPYTSKEGRKEHDEILEEIKKWKK